MHVVGSLHPAFILRQNARLAGTVEHAMAKAIKLAYGKKTGSWSEEEFILNPSADDIVRVLGSMAGKDVAFDVETDGDHPLECALRCIGFYDGAKGIIVPLLYRNGERVEVEVTDERSGKSKVENHARWVPYFTGDALKKVLLAVQNLLVGAKVKKVEATKEAKKKDRKAVKKLKSAGREVAKTRLPETFEELLAQRTPSPMAARSVITQNGQYDRTVLKQALGIEVAAGATGFTFDTIIAHHVLASYLPHRLGFLAALYTEAPYYKSTDDGEAWSAGTDEELWRYCVRDVKATWLSAQTMRHELLEAGYQAAPHVFMHDMWQEEECRRWTEAGILCDLPTLRYYRFHYSSVRDRALVAMKEVVARVLQRAGDAKSDAEGHLAALLTKLEGKAEKERRRRSRRAREDLEEDEQLANDGSARTVEVFNPGSLIELRFILQGLKIPLHELTATDQLSTAKELLTAARKSLLAQKVDPDDDRIAFLDYLFAWRESAKVVSTYLFPELLKDGRVHPTFKPYVVPTGRLCMAAQTPVRTKERGWVTIDKVTPGLHVWTHRQRWRKVLTLHRNGIRSVVDIHLQNGEVLTSTTDHRFLGVDGWVTAGELREHLEALAGGEVELGSRGRPLSKPQLALSRIHCEDVGGYARYCDGSLEAGFVERGHSSIGPSSVFSVQDGTQKPDEGQDRIEASPLAGTLRGPKRVLDDSLEREASLRTPRRGDGGVGCDQTSSENDGSSHRRGQGEQRPRQPRVGDGTGAQGDSLPRSKGLDGCVVEAVVAGGCCSTFDLEVEEDHSFEVGGGVFSHNCSSGPNFQNQPAEIRGMFVAKPGYVLVSMDWDALEMRLGAFQSKDKKFIEVFFKYDTKTGPKPHIANMAAIFGLPATQEAADQNPGMYRAAKVFAYAVAYGAGEDTVYEQVREELPDMKWDDFLIAFKNYKATYPEFFAFMREVVRKGSKGHLDSGLLQRRVYFFERSWGESSPEATAMQNMPFQCITSRMRVLTERGYQPIGSLKGPQQVWTGQRWAPAKVVKKGLEPITRVTLSNGIELEVDPSHRFLRDDKTQHTWVTTKDLKKGTRLALDAARPLEFGQSERSLETAWAAGFYTGNGWCSDERGDLVLVVGDSEVREHSRRPDTIIPRLMHLAPFRAYDDVGCTRLSLFGKKGRSWARELGVDSKQRAKTKRIPSWVWSAPCSHRAAFLEGLLDADGTVGGDKDVRLNMSQRDLLQEVWLLARTVGVTGQLYGPYETDQQGHLAWVLCLNAGQCQDFIPWGRGRVTKTKQLVPNFVAREAIGERRWPRGTSHQVISSRIRNGGTAGPYTLLAMGCMHPELYDYAEVVRVESTKKREAVFTLMVDDEQHRYAAEGTIAKNSGGADVVGRANRRIMDRLVIPWRETRLKPGETLEQLAQVHDELLFEVPERLAEEFEKELKVIAEEKPTLVDGTVLPDWNLPVSIHTDRRWKPVQARCGAKMMKDGKPTKCKELIDIELEDGSETVWVGECKHKHQKRIDVEERKAA